MDSKVATIIVDMTKESFEHTKNAHLDQTTEE